MGVHRATACVIGDEEAVHQARRTARAGVHRTRGIGRRAACGGPIGQEEQLCCPPIGQARTHHTLFFLPNGHMLFFVSTDPPPAVLPARWTQHTLPCLTGPPQAVLVCSTDRWATTRCSSCPMGGQQSCSSCPMGPPHAALLARFLVSDGPQHALFFLLDGPLFVPDDTCRCPMGPQHLLFL